MARSRRVETPIHLPGALRRGRSRGQRSGRHAKAAPVPMRPKHAGHSPAARWRPWQGQPRARDLCCFVAFAVSVIYGAAMIPITPELIASHPLLLELLSGSSSSIVAAGSFSAAGNKLALLQVIAAPLPGMLRFNWLIWWAGRLWGPRVAERLGSRSPRVAAITANVHRRGARLAKSAVLLAALVPGSGVPVYVAAGWVGLPLLTFLIFNTIGCMGWTAMLAICGYLLGSRGVALAGLVSRYGLAWAAVFALVMVARYARRARRARATTRRDAWRGTARYSGSGQPDPADSLKP
jgi:membrane protein DedA with SNARE-associated domain